MNNTITSVNSLSCGIADPIDCQTAEDLLDHVNRRNPLWDGTPTEWIFRGHADAAWELQPKSLRDQFLNQYCPTHDGAPPTNLLQAQAERLLVRQFVQKADQLGVPIPNANELHGKVTSLGEELLNSLLEDASPPPREFMPWYALAQHYGIPTRLLDWSRDPRVAMYFAAKDAAVWATHPARIAVGHSRKIGVWALRERHVSNLMSHPESKGGNLQIITVPSLSNQNLVAQRGLFTLHRPDHLPEQDPVWRERLDTFLAGIFEQSRHLPLGRKPFMYHFRLGIEQAPRLLELLSEEFIDAAFIFPGLGGVAQSILETEIWASRKRTNR